MGALSDHMGLKRWEGNKERQREMVMHLHKHILFALCQQADAILHWQYLRNWIKLIFQYL